MGYWVIFPLLRAILTVMNVYFTASIAAKDKYMKNYQAIIRNLEKRKFVVVADHILQVTEDHIRLKGREERIAFHEQLEKWISTCNFMVAETSFPSISVGYEISLALRLGKPVLILYSEGDPPSLLAHHHNENLGCEMYTLQTLDDIMENFITYVEGKSDMRFTFFISAQIASYLDTISRTDKIPKSVYLRQLIEKDMRDRKKRIPLHNGLNGINDQR